MLRLLLALTLPVAILILWLTGVLGPGHQAATGVKHQGPYRNAAGSAVNSQQNTASRGTSDHRVRWVDKQTLGARMHRIAEATGAKVGVAVQPLDGSPPVKAGLLQAGASWSTMKVPVILARYRLAKSLRQPPAKITERVARAITESDNEAIDSLFEEISNAKGGLVSGSRYVQSILEDAGDTHTVVNTVPPPGGFSTFGQTRWSLGQGTRFYAALARGCLSPVSASKLILRLMAEIVPSQRWGLGQAPFRGISRVLFKGGWGPDPTGRYLVRQFGIIQTPTGRGLVVGVIDKPVDGTFESGVKVLNQISDAVGQSVYPDKSPAKRTC